MIIDRVVSLWAPHVCVGCRREGEVYCATCIATGALEVPSRCFLCHEMTQDSATCRSCRKKTPLRNVWVSTRLEGATESLVKKIKYGRAKIVAQYIAEIMDDQLPHFEDMVITHLPTARLRVRRRGYDQAQLIAKNLAKRRGMEHKNLLGRRGKTQQVGSNRSERIEQLDGAFFTIRPCDNPVLIIDDVLTTGASLDMAAKELKKSGIKKVYGATFAQKL